MQLEAERIQKESIVEANKLLSKQIMEPLTDIK